MEGNYGLDKERQPCEEALSLDICILRLILQRNRKQHFRAQYYRRLNMVLLAIDKYQILGSSGNALSTDGCDFDTDKVSTSLGNTIRAVGREHDRIGSIVDRQKGCQKRYSGGRSTTEEEEWFAVSSKESEPKGKIQYNENVLLHLLNSLYNMVTRYLPEILSRIHHAASALYTELSRGYFIPLCTVSLACISRIRVLIMRLGRESTVQLQRTLGWIRKDFLSFATSGGSLERITGLNVEEATRIAKQFVLKDDSMNDFIEISDNEHNNFVQKLRNSILMRGGSYVSSTGAKKSSRNVYSSGNEQTGTQSLGNSSSKSIASTENIMESFYSNDATTEKTALENDLGESFYMSLLSNDNEGTLKNDKKSKSSDNIDRNLEIVMLMKTKKKGEKDEGKSTKRKMKDIESKETVGKISNSKASSIKEGKVSTEDFDTSSKKKKRKKKKKKKKDIFDDLFSAL